MNDREEPSTIEIVTAYVTILVFAVVAVWAIWHLAEALAR